jgi:DNA-binding transcriptional MerR regulator/methylmalonyl-CoA mutase cobalamin-binding subunit
MRTTCSFVIQSTTENIVDREENGLTLSIGAVSRATGVPANTLRTWERRYGFPKPLRTEGGQRAYDASIVPHLIEIARALDRGLRPREALTASREELARYAVPDITTGSTERTALMEAVQKLDSVALKRQLRMLWAERGGVACIDEVIAPLVRDMGTAWAQGELEVYQEHFSSEVIRSFLGEQWRPLAETAHGPMTVLATPSGEPHDLGLQFAATTLALTGRQIRYLGANTPVGDILGACRGGPVEACAISVSAFADKEAMAEALEEIQRGLPDGITLLLGGSGAPHVDRAVRMTSCASLYAWAKPGA